MKITLLLSALALVFFSFGQTFQITDQYVFGGYQFDGANNLIEVDDNLILGGVSHSGISGNKTTPNYGESDIWILSLDDNRDIEWERSYGGSLTENVSKVIHTSDNHLLVLGTSNSGDDGNKITTNKGLDDIWLIKLDLQGNEIWQKSYGGSGDEYAIQMFEKTDGSFLIVGSSDSPISGDKSEASLGGTDYWILNIDINGNVLWDKTIGGSDLDIAQDACMDQDGNVVIVGSSLSPISHDKTEDNFSIWSDLWLVKIDTSGNVIWDRTIGGDSGESCRKIILSENRIYTLAFSSSNISGTKSDSSRGFEDYWITKMDFEDGAVIIDKTYGGSQTDVIDDGLLSIDGDLVVTGATSGPASGEVEFSSHNNSIDYWTIVVDTSDLELKYQFMIGGTASDYYSRIYEKANNSYFLFGISNSGFGADKNSSSKGEYDIWLLELSTDLSTSNFQKEETLSIYPNPTSNSFQINELPDGGNYVLSIIDMMGKSVLRSTVNSAHNHVDVNLLSPGIYTLQMIDGEKSYTSKLIVE